jgi:hypothetical protein
MKYDCKDFRLVQPEERLYTPEAWFIKSTVQNVNHILLHLHSRVVDI